MYATAAHSSGAPKAHTRKKVAAVRRETKRLEENARAIDLTVIKIVWCMFQRQNCQLGVRRSFIVWSRQKIWCLQTQTCTRTPTQTHTHGPCYFCLCCRLLLHHVRYCQSPICYSTEDIGPGAPALCQVRKVSKLTSDPNQTAHLRIILKFLLFLSSRKFLFKRHQAALTQDVFVICMTADWSIEPIRF